MTTWFRFVPLRMVQTFMLRGWTVDDDLSETPHGEYSVLMRGGGLVSRREFLDGRGQ